MKSLPMSPAQLAGRLAPIEITGSTTATLNRWHVVTATATLTDPTPAQGAGYFVFVRNGTATVGGTAYPTGTIIARFYHSGAWSPNRAYSSLETANRIPKGNGTALQDSQIADSVSGGVLTISGTLASDRTWTIPDRSDTVAGLGAQTFTGTQTFAAGSAAAPSAAMVDAGLGFYRVSANVGGASASGVASFQWSSTTFDILRGMLQVIPTTGTAEARVEIGATRGGDGNSYIDLVGDTTYTGYGLRLIRSAGANGTSTLAHRGTGRLEIAAQDAGDIDVVTSNTARGRCYADGGFQWGGTLGTSPGFGQALFGGTVTCQADLVRSFASGDGRLVIRGGASGTNRILSFQTGDTNGLRWEILTTNVAESGSDAGSNFGINAFTDGGVYVDSPLTIDRAAGGLITLARPVSVTNTTASTNTTTGALVVSGGLGIAGAQFIGGSLTVGTSADSINLVHDAQNRLVIAADSSNSTFTAGSGQSLGLAAPTGKTVYATFAGVERMRLGAAGMFFQPTTALNVNAATLGASIPFTGASNTGVSYPTDVSFLRARASTDINKGLAGVFGLSIGTANAPTVAGVHGIGTTTGGDGHAVGIRGEGVMASGGGVGSSSAVGGVFDARSASTTAGKTSYGIKAYASASGASNAASLTGILLQVTPAASSAAAQLADATLTIPSAYTGTTVKGIGVTLNWTGTASTTAATVRGLDLSMTVNQGAALGYTGILVNVTETATGSGAKNLLDLQTGGTTRFSVSNTGLTTITDATAAISTISAALVVTGGAGIGGAVFVGGNIDTATAFLRGGVQVLGPRITGWAAATGTATRTTFDTATVTTAQLAERVKALIDDFRTHGAIGT